MDYKRNTVIPPVQNFEEAQTLAVELIPDTNPDPDLNTEREQYPVHTLLGRVKEARNILAPVLYALSGKGNVTVAGLLGITNDPSVGAALLAATPEGRAVQDQWTRADADPGWTCWDLLRQVLGSYYRGGE